MRTGSPCLNAEVTSSPAAPPPPGPLAGLESQAAVMAVVNRTPDSFSDGGRTYRLRDAARACLRAAEQGADWVDIGGVPFSPDAAPVSVAEEIDRVVPVVAAVREACAVTISVDTTRHEVAAAAIAAGATVINDTSGLGDPAMAELVADTGATIVITHSLAAPGQHLPRPRYDDVVAEVAAFLSQRCERARALGIDDSRMVLDPGPDLNKTTRHSLQLMRDFSRFVAIGLPTMAAVSRKDFIGETLDRPHGHRLVGSLVAAAWCVQQGAQVVRCHDVAETVDMVRMCAAMAGTREPAIERHNV